MPFTSAASELVDERLHPLAQLKHLDAKVKELEAQKDTDAVIECRIKQLSLRKLLVILYEFPLMPLLQAEVALAEAYASGGFFKQAREHIARAREGSNSIHIDAQCQRLQVDVQIAEGVLLLGEGQSENARAALREGHRLARSLYGENDLRIGRVSVLLGELAEQKASWCESEARRLERVRPTSGQIAALKGQAKEQRAQVIDCFADAWAVHEQVDGPSAEQTIRILIRVAEAEHEDGRADDAIVTMRQALQSLEKLQSVNKKHVLLLVDAAAQMARWLEAQGDDDEALRFLNVAEKAAAESLDEENAKAVEIRRDKALLHLKLGSRDASHYDQALQYLHDVHYYQRRLHGSQSTNVARTLKALGTVHMARRNYVEAEQCLHQALHIFKVEPTQNAGVVRDIHAKLKQIEATA